MIEIKNVSDWQELIEVTIRELLWVLVDLPKEHIVVRLGGIEIHYSIEELEANKKSVFGFVSYIRSKLHKNQIVEAKSRLEKKNEQNP